MYDQMTFKVKTYNQLVGQLADIIPTSSIPIDVGKRCIRAPGAPPPTTGVVICILETGISVMDFVQDFLVTNDGNRKYVIFSQFIVVKQLTKISNQKSS